MNKIHPIRAAVAIMAIATLCFITSHQVIYAGQYAELCIGALAGIAGAVTTFFFKTD